MNLDAIQLNANVDLASPQGEGQPLRQESALTSNPFIGLRPFESEESVLFFGRDKQIVELLQQLHRTRFLAVVGSSGCGKSSLIRAGLVPKLRAGFLVERRERWNVIKLKPGGAPLRNLASAVLGASGEEPTAEMVAAFVKKMRVEGAETIVSHIAGSLDEAGANLLLLVDQFEEIFRFVLSSSPDEMPAAALGNAAAERGEAVAAGASKERRSDEAARFVSIILELSRQRRLPVYVVLTMRSDFISDYDLFSGLPEAVNGNMYLVPRLNRQQYEDAVKGPVRLYGREIAPRLLDRIVNDLGGESDQLPVMQHALMRTWENCSQREDEGPLDLPQYEAAGTIKNALSWDAEKAMDELAEDETEIAERLFQALVDTDNHGRRVRRPVRLSEIEERTGAPPEKILDVIERFQRDGRCFLTLSSERIEDDPLIDISHESFIRQWNRLREWVEKEDESRELYTRIAEAALRHEAGRGGLWGDPDLQQALDWWEKRKPNEAWAVRYHRAFKAASEFLEASEKQREKDKAEEERQRLEGLQNEKIRRQNALLRRLTYALVIISLLAFAGVVVATGAVTRSRLSEARAKESEAQARKSQALAQQSATALRNSFETIRLAKEEADKQRVLADEAREKAEAEGKRARDEKERADEQALIAKNKAAEAVDAREKLKAAKDNQERALIEARRKLLGDLGGYYQQAISQSGDAATRSKAAETYEKIYAIYNNDNVRAGKVSTSLLLAKLYDKPDRDGAGDDDKHALEYYGRALELFDLKNSAEKDEAISALISMGDLLNNTKELADRAKAAERYERALDMGYKPSISDDGGVYRKLGDIYAVSQKADDMRKAIKYYELALSGLDAKIAVREENPPDDDLGLRQLQVNKLALLIKLGTLNKRVGQQQKAEERYSSAVKLALDKRIGNGEIGALVNIGLSLNLPGEKEEQAEYFARAIKKGETDSKDPEAVANTSFLIGRGLYNKKDYQTAALYLERAVDLYPGLGESRINEAGALQALGNSYRAMKMKQKALENYRLALKIYDELGEESLMVARLRYTISSLEEESPTAR